MYKNAEAALDRILELARRCPKEFQDKCFEVLLAGYVQLEVTGAKPSAPVTPTAPTLATATPPATESHIPPLVLPRFRNAAKRLGTTLEKLEALFDFSVDPFALHAVTLPGKNNAAKTRNVALLAAGRTYLATGSWSADWQEIKSLCVDHNCYDLPNHAVNLKKGATGASAIFKTVEPGEPIELSSGGIKEAEKLLKSIAEETAAV